LANSLRIPSLFEQNKIGTKVTTWPKKITYVALLFMGAYVIKQFPKSWGELLLQSILIMIFGTLVFVIIKNFDSIKQSFKADTLNRQLNNSLHQAKQFVAEGKYSEAEKIFQDKILKLHPEKYVVLWRLYRDANQIERYVQTLQQTFEFIQRTRVTEKSANLGSLASEAAAELAAMNLDTDSPYYNPDNAYALTIKHNAGDHYLLGKMYFHGLGCLQSYLKAYKHFSKVYEANLYAYFSNEGLVQGLHYLAFQELNGLGTEQNQEKAYRTALIADAFHTKNEFVFEGRVITSGSLMQLIEMGLAEKTQRQIRQEVEHFLSDEKQIYFQMSK
jgi:hypothetical protein